MAKVKCHKVYIPQSVCSIRFSEKRGIYHHTKDEQYITIRGEDVYLEFDKRNRLVGIELIGSGKPCMQSIGRLVKPIVRKKRMRRKS